MVLQDKARIRVQLCTKHTTQQLETAIEAFKEGGKSLGLI
jgi:7-keto-8-aminopelargonate synthetase-like enzyme